MEVEAVAIERAIEMILAAGGTIVYPDPNPPEPVEGSAEWLETLCVSDYDAWLKIVHPLDWLEIHDPDEWLRITDAQSWVEAHDTRARVTTTKPVNLGQLDAEMGKVGLCGGSLNDLGTPEVKCEVVAPEGVTEKQLKDAIAAHVAMPDSEPTPAEKLARFGLTPAELKKLVA